ncbi:proton-conducting transporter membrane subunit [Cellulomonas sp. SG140]|uniref:proton-conducting transporter transmembrane domain-containing protein n=1 Tax=Cellulomonas sp. SG140 TaxID=2976536 RepID=UPI0021E99179|nr:proton-conducting transporter membrane subunit [Cellulomonas sp. SG140]
MGLLLLLPPVAALLAGLAAAAPRPAVPSAAGPRAAGPRSGVPALAGLASATTRLSGVLVSAILLATGVALLVHRGAVPTLGGDLLRADALSALMLTVVGAVGLTATWAGLEPRTSPATSAPTGATRSERRYAALVCVFLGAMAIAVTTDNLGVLWVAVEATTIATAFLVGHRGGARSLEAAWKYVVLGSVGIAIALLGTVLLYAASRSAGEPTLSWTRLVSGELPLDPALVKVAAGLAVLGFATKAGLAPMHSWLPDAHSQAPAPVSGLMSGVLLAVAFYAILRVRAVAAVVIGPGLVRGLLLAAGLGSLAVAGALILRQRDHKRMLAYSSIEHMGVLAVGAAVGGPVALAAVLLHLIGHGLAKASLFVVAGRVLASEGTTTIAEVRGLLSRRADLAVPLVVGMAALLGFPPFALFFSEVAIVLAGWRAGLGWAMALVVALLLVVVAGLVRATAAMTLGRAEQAPAVHDEPQAHGADRGPVLPLVLALGTTAVIGFVASPVGDVLTRAAAVLGLS